MDPRPQAIIAAKRAFLRSEARDLRNHLSAAIGKTGSTNRAEAVLLADEAGWL